MKAHMDTYFPEILRGSLWHTTCSDLYQRIISDGFISPNPDIPDSSRWKTRLGQDYYPYVRHIGGVSLFEFNGFDPDEYDKACPMSSWRTFVPFQKSRGHSIWIEIDRNSVQEAYLSPAELAKRQREESAERHTLMPRIEAAVIGFIPSTAFLRVLLRSAGNDVFEEVN